MVEHAAHEETVAVLIADVCGSTPLYERSGSERALDLIAECLEGVSGIVEQEGGRVLRSMGDDILCTFEDPSAAIRAASRMVDRQIGKPVQIHVGMSYGDMLETESGLFGDTVNVAARLLSIAKPGEVLATEALVKRLSGEEREHVRLLDNLTVKGKSLPVGIYAVFRDEEDVTYHVDENGYRTVRLRSIERPSSPRAVVTLEFRGESHVRREGQDVLRIGRSPRCDLVVVEPCVSREHATINVRRGRVLLTDLSSTGTWVKAGDAEPLLLKRDVMQLSGDGIISPGLRPHDDAPTLIEYRLWTESRSGASETRGSDDS